MALEDLVSDLSNFKTKGETAYDKLDPQINNGVDYFPNDDAPGFTPKTNLESLYHKANSAVSAKPPGFVPASDGQFSQRWNSNFPTQFKNGFFPIANAVSNYNPPTNDSLTFNVGQHSSTGPTQFTITPFDDIPRILEAHGSDFMNTPILDFKGIYTPPENITQTFNLEPKNTGIDFTKWGEGFTTIGGDVNKFAILSAPRPYISQFASPNTRGVVNKFTKPKGFSGMQVTMALPKENWRLVAGEPLFDTFNSDFKPTTLKREYKDSTSLKDLFEFRKDGRDTFKNVPSGINENGKFGTTDFRTIANKGPFDGNSTHPIILRKPGSNWDNVLNESVIGGSAGDVVAGALGVVGLLTRTSVGLADKARVFRFLISSKGISFVAKQFAFQALNPTLESKIYNPLSTLGIAGASDLLQGDLSGLLRAAGSFLFPTHVERHLGGTRYEKIILGPAGSRIYRTAQAFGMDLTGNFNVPTSNTGVGMFDNYVNRQVSRTMASVDAGLLTPMFGLSNPNKYAFPISSAPKSVVDGKPTFIGSVDLALEDVRGALEKPGGTFNKETSFSTPAENESIKRFRTKAYDLLSHKHSYYDIINNGGNTFHMYGRSEEHENEQYDLHHQKSNDRHFIRNLGDPGKVGRAGTMGNITGSDSLGVIKKSTTNKIVTSAVDKVNIHPYGSKDLGKYDFNKGTKDFIKFRFHDIINGKFIIFRAILEGITDAVTPEYSEQDYIGRPDTLYTYQGVTRQLSFSFSIYPKTKQELPVLMEKLNYLVGMCYPSYTADERMITPFMELTMGDMFVDTPGILSGLTMTVEEQSTWELDDGLQFPHYIKAACEFKHIGNHVPASKGKHYDLPWIPDGVSGKSLRNSGKQLGFPDFPYRNNDKDFIPIFTQLGQDQEKVDKVKDLG